MKFYIKDEDQNDIRFLQIEESDIDEDTEVYVQTDNGFVPYKAEEDEKDEKPKGEAPAIRTDGKSEVEKLTDTLKEFGKSVEAIKGKNPENAYKEKMEEMEAKMANLQEAQKRGFVLPSGSYEGDSKSSEAIFDKAWIAKQGKDLMNDQRHPKHHVDNETREELAKWMNLVIRAGYFGDVRAQLAFNDIYKTGSDALGDVSNNSFPLTDLVEDEILHYAYEDSVVLQQGTVRPMGTEKTSYPVESSGASFSWSNTTSESTPTATEFELDAQEVSAYAEVRNTMLEDSESDIVSWLYELMSADLGQELDSQAFTGTGSPCSGLLTSKCGYSVQMGNGSAAFSMIGDDVLSEMIMKLNGKRKQGARFFMHGEILHYVRQLKDTNGQPIFVERVGTPVPGTIYGYPYSEVVEMTSTSASSTGFVVFGNLKNFYLGRRKGATKLEVNTQGDTTWTTNRTRFKLYARWALGIALPNGFVRLMTSAT